MIELGLFIVGVGVGACLPQLATAMTHEHNTSRSATTSGITKGR